MILTAMVMQAALMSGCSTEVAQPSLCATTEVAGHRCRTYAQHKTKENTVAALKEVAAKGVRWCEIDAWRIADGTVVVWHDSTWSRVADPATRPSSLPRLVKDATWAEAKGIRTRGGARITTLKRMIRAAGRHDVDLIVEVKNSVPDPGAVLSYAAVRGVKTKWYQTPSSANCGVNMVVRFTDAGGEAGLKQPGSGTCRRTPEEAAALGGFVAENNSLVSPELAAAYRLLGVEVYAKLAGRRDWPRMVASQAHIITNKPGRAVTWLAQ